MVCLHATDPASVFLSARARIDGMAVADLERALYHERSLVKHLAMRRTLFVFPREVLAPARGACRRMAAAERRRLVTQVEAAGLRRDGERWLAEACEAVLGALATGREASSSELRKELPVLESSLEYGEGRSWGGRMSVGPRVLTVLSAEGLVVRGPNDGTWAVSRPRWAALGAWLGHELEDVSEEDGTRMLVEAWLRRFGPGTEADLKWWLGSTLGLVRRALGELGAVAVDLDGRTGFVLPDDLEPEEPVEPWGALLPPLDATTMGWYERDWYLGGHRPQLFDTAGNAGPTAWWNGRIVGGWRQDEAGAVELQLLEHVGAEARRALGREVERLTAWLGGTRVLPRFPSPLWRG